MLEPCSNCGYQPEETVMGLIFQAAMRKDFTGSDDGLGEKLRTNINAISPALHAEFQQEGTRHPLAHKTISEIRAIAIAGELPTEGSEVRINRADAEMDEWNRRVHADELTDEQKQSVIDRVTTSQEVLAQAGWVNPY